MMAKVTLLNDRHEGINISCIIGAGGKAVFATDTPMFIDDDDSIILSPCGLDRTIDDTGWMVALIAEGREKMACDVGVPSLFDDFHP